MAISTPRLVRSRHGTYYFRLIVPNRLIQFVGQTEIRRTLKTKSTHKAKLIALNLSIYFEKLTSDAQLVTAMNDFKKSRPQPVDLNSAELITRFRPDGTIEFDIQNEHDADLADKIMKNPTFAQFGSIPQNSNRLLIPNRPQIISSVIDLYLQDHVDRSNVKNRTNKEKSNIERRSTMNRLLEFLESDFNASGLTKNSEIHLLNPDFLHKFFYFYATRSPKTKSDQTQSQNATLALGTLKKTKSHIFNLLNFSLRIEAIRAESAVFEKHTAQALLRTLKEITNNNNKSESYDAFDFEEIQRIFRPATFLANTHGRSDLFWGTLLATTLGMRAGEIATLRFKHVIKIQNHDVHVISTHRDNVKNENSVRNTPIPDVLIDIGFITFLDKVRRLLAEVGLTEDEIQNSLIFCHRDEQIATFKSDPSKRISDFFTKFKKTPELNLNNSRKVFHSFRHTTISILDALGVEAKIQKTLVGHETDDTNSNNIRSNWRMQTNGMNNLYTHSLKGYENLLPSEVRNKSLLDNLAQSLKLDIVNLKKIATFVDEHLLIRKNRQEQAAPLVSGWNAGYKKEKSMLKMLHSD